MTFMAFSQLSGDMTSVSENVELARRLYGAEGATRVAGSVALTGQNVGSFTLSTMWDSSDACFAAREKVLATVEMQEATAAVSIQTKVCGGWKKRRRAQASEEPVRDRIEGGA